MENFTTFYNAHLTLCIKNTYMTEGNSLCSRRKIIYRECNMVKLSFLLVSSKEVVIKKKASI